MTAHLLLMVNEILRGIRFVILVLGDLSPRRIGKCGVSSAVGRLRRQVFRNPLYGSHGLSRECNGLLVEANHVLPDQFVENIVFKLDPLASAGALDILEEIDRGIPGVTYSTIPDSPNDLLELLFPPCAVA